MACRRAVGVDVLHEFDVHIFYPLLLKRGQYCLSLHIVESFLVVDECDSEWDIIFSALLLPLLYDGGGGGIYECDNHKSEMSKESEEKINII